MPVGSILCLLIQYNLTSFCYNNGNDKVLATKKPLNRGAFLKEFKYCYSALAGFFMIAYTSIAKPINIIIGAIVMRLAL